MISMGSRLDPWDLLWDPVGGHDDERRADLRLRPGRPALEDHDDVDATATRHLCGAC